MRKIILKLIISLGIILLPIFSIGQQISGLVLTKGKGLPVESANVVLKTLDIGTATDTEGHFEFKNIPAGKYRLVVSMVGFQKQTFIVEVKKEKQAFVKILLVPQIQKIEEVKVTGNYQQLGLIEDPMIERTSVMPSVSKITKVEIEKQGSGTLIEALKFVPGGWIETRGRKVKQFFSVRGQKYPYPTYSINGIWQKEFHEMPYFFNSSNIESVQIVRSSSALLKSLSALTGVVNVETSRLGKEQVGLFAKYGSLNSYQSGISYGNSGKKLAYSGSVNRFGTDGPQGRNGKEQVWNAHGFVEWDINPALDVTVNFFYLDGMRQMVQPIAPADPKFIGRQEVYKPLNSVMISSKIRYSANEKFSSELHLNYSGRNPTYKNENLKTGEITGYDESDRELTINQINAFAIGTYNTLRFGALYNYWIAPEGKRFYYGRKGEIHTISGVVADQHSFGKLLLDAGFRLTREYYAEWGGFSIEGSGGKFGNVAPITKEWQPLVWQATSGVSYMLTTKTSLHFTVASGIVTPRKGALDNNGESPKNEVRSNYDIGLVKNIGPSGKFTLTVFKVRRKDAIEFSGNTVENGLDIMELYQNTDKRNFGIEIDAKSPVLANLFSLFANLTLMKGQISSEDGWQKDDEMPMVVANWGGNLQKGRFDLNAYINYTGEYKNDRFVSKDYLLENGKAPLGNFVTLDLTAGYLVGKEKSTRLFVEMKNLFDKQFQTVAGYPDYGRLVSVGVNVKL